MTIDGLKINYYENGPADDNSGAEKLLFLHGWGVGYDTYSVLLTFLSKKYHVFAPDMPGFSRSDEPPAPLDVDGFTDFAIKFAAAAGIERAHLVVHSHGCRVALKMLARRPGGITNEDGELILKAPEITKLVIIDGAGMPPRRGLRYHVQVRTFKIAKKFFNIRPFNKMFRKAWERLNSSAGSEDYRLASPVMKKTLVRVVNEDLTPCLDKINIPTLLLWGEEDSHTPLSDGKLMESRIPGAGLVVIKHGGHYSFLDDWSTARGAIDYFLKQ